MQMLRVPRLCAPSPLLWLRLVCLVAVVAPLPGCGGGGSGGSSGSTPPAPSATGLDFTITPAVGGATVVDFRWSGSGASSYRVEVGSTSGASDVATLASAGAATTLQWPRVPVGTFYARVRGLQGATVSLPSNEVLIGSIDARLIIDAELFAYGPLAVAGNPGRNINSSVRERMLGWQPGTGFGVILGESVPTAFVSAAEKTVQQVAMVTQGLVQAGIIGRGPDPLPIPRPGEVTMSMLSAQALKDECGCETCIGCARTFYQGALAQRSQIYMSNRVDVTIVSHELGHVIGLAHIISAAGVHPAFTMGVSTDGQSGDRDLGELDPATLQMLSTVYGAGLNAGSTRRQFEAAGLVLPEGTGSLSLAAVERSRGGYVVTQDGIETVVFKTLCQ